MSQDTFNQGFGALAPPNPRRLPFDFNDHDPPLSLPPPPPPTRGHQRSRTTVDLPPLFTRTQSSSPTRSSAFSFLRPQSTRSLSPERLSAAEVAEDPVPAESPAKRKSGALASWFEGSSDPVNITLVPSARKEKLDPVYETATTAEAFSMSSDSIDNNLTRRPPRKPSLPGPAVSTMSKFNIFRRSTMTQNAPEDLDELAQLDIDDALFPHGHPDEFSPAAFKNLQLNAEGAIRRFQQAYKEQRQSLRSATSIKNVQADELEAAQTRNEHLKLQLQEMAERAAEQEKLIADLRAQLSAQLSLESQQQSIRMVPQDIDSKPRPKYRRYRSSDVSTSGESEAGSEVSSVVSIFSEALSAAPSQNTSIASPVLKSASMVRDNCPRCHGLRSSDAWDVVGMMKMESAALKNRIAELESAQDDALDFLSGLKLSS
ncbi:uncharacterized protein Z519_02320 [Cladophialophora bantiana CBS 173.52]|uniref:GDP/GTP exchange factor Sec2 N-terminal domain-containing protein n=1 Tax=Cladophialophora bantiana (strain ATCC 10958 / CBS 173.52 / CDC B-1940 / NIH 8579) TaxID=1442370 RepID=A0A0D2IJK0_CLAB1|nr:uncharacterized protein Z519_02320 [Cladophialophora bantiana CBS 173.52]KIW96929.1 hypothetical protein Z519_02320 [Cladophialophora bantiana CBS 173.52]